MIKKELLRNTLIVSCLLLMEMSAFAQKENSAPGTMNSDTNALQKPRSGLFAFIKRLFHKPSAGDYVRKNKKRKSDSTALNSSKKVEPVELTKGGLNWTSLYTKGVNLNTGVSGLYSLGRLTQGIDLYGLPFKMQGTGVFENGQFERNYSSYSINFDVDAYKSDLRKRAADILLNKKMVQKVPSISDSLEAFESLGKKLQSPSYQAEESTAMIQFKKDQDSAQKHPGADTAELHALRQKVNTYQQLGKRYQQLFALKLNSSKFEKEDSASKGISKDQRMLNNPDSVEKILENNHQISGFEKFLDGMKRFRIGNCTEEISEFTLHNFMMNGISTAYSYDGITTDAGYGKEVAVVDPFLMTGVNVPNYNRSVEFVRSGVGSEDGSCLYGTAVRISDPGGNTNSMAESSWVLDLVKQVAVGKNLLLQGEISKSNFTYSPGKTDSIALPFIPTDNNTIAYALRAKGIVPVLKTVIKAEYSQTGGDFVSLGNPFLISGTTKYQLDFNQPLGQKFSVDIGGTHILEKLAVNPGAKETDNWLQFSAICKPTRLIDLELKYSPRQFQQEEGQVYANNIACNINQLSFTGTMSSRIFGTNTTTSFFGGNFQYGMTETSQMLSQNLSLTYYMLNQMVLLCPSQAINFTINESRNHWTGSLSEFVGQGTYNWNLPKSLTLGLGPQWVEQPGVIPDEAGLTGSIGSRIGKWGRVGIQGTFRNSVDKPFSDKPQYLTNANLSILW